MAELTLRFDLRFGARTLRCLMAAGMVFSVATEVASESVTLSTYYPAPSGVYSQMITTGNTYLARDAATNGGRVGIGTTAPALLFHEVFNGANWAALIQSASGGNTASAYFAHAGGYGAYIDAGGAANSGTYALDVNRSGTPYLYVRGDGYIGVGTANPQRNLDVAGSSGDYGYLPHYQNWATYGTGDGGAAIYNDPTAYQTLMIVGNNSAGGTRRVSVWDQLLVNGTEYVASGSYNASTYVNGAGGSCGWTNFVAGPNTPICPAGQYVTLETGVMSKYTAIVNGLDPAGEAFCCPCPAGLNVGYISSCPNL
jgi:hypothetical protein